MPCGHRTISGAMVLNADTPMLQDLMRFKPDSLTPNGWAVSAGVSRTVWSDMRRHGNPSRRTLEKLLTAVGSTLAEFEALRIGDGAATPPPRSARGLSDAGTGGWRSAPLSPIPLVATSLAGEWEIGSGIEQLWIFSDRRIGEVERPASLARDRAAFALTMLDDAMWPRFRPGRRLLISPLAPVAIGDDVLVTLAGSTDGAALDGQVALVKEMVRRTSRFVELRQFNPGATFKIDAAAVAAIHKVVGEVI